MEEIEEGEEKSKKLNEIDNKIKKSITDININNDIIHSNNNNINKEEESESETESIGLEQNGENKIIFLSKEQIAKLKEREKEKEEYLKKEKERINAKHKRAYLRTKKRYLQMLEKEKEEENKKYKQKEEEENEEEENNDITKKLSKKEKNKMTELKLIKEYYIGKEGPKIIKKKENKPKEMIKDFFVFEWKDTEDTTEKKNFLPVMTPKIMFGKGVVGGLENKDDMKDYYNFNEEDKKKRLLKIKKRKKSGSKSRSNSRSRERSRSKSKSKDNKEDDNKNKDDKVNEKEKIKNEIKKRIQPKLNDGTKKFNWKDFNTIYKY